MKLRHPMLIRGLAFAGAVLLKGWMSTLRIRLDFGEGPRHPPDPRRLRYLYAFWHEHIPLASCFDAKIDMLISKHADGEFISQLARHLGKGAVRGSSRRGGSGAMLELIRRCRQKDQNHLGITPDGPRGPRRRVQPGLIFLASKTGLPIVPVGFGYEKAWRMRSWDRMALPCPYSLATGVFDAPIQVPAKLGQSGLEMYQRFVEERLHQLTDAAERWGTGRARLPLAA
jgi:lysophospholipid acyltransferase (LPLAT)-like uncharacterized protein